MTGEPIISLDEVSVRFGRQTVHRDITFSICPGESVTLLGPSGTGKTVLLKLIIGLLRPATGSVTVMGTRMDAAPEEELREKRREIGMLFQGAALFDSLSVYENVAYPLRERGMKDDAEISAIVAEKLGIVGLAGTEEKYPAQLSGGMKKRVGLARALASSPRIMLFDEPTTGLDPTSTRLIDDLIVKLNREHDITCVAVTHDIGSARRFSTRWILLNEGRIVADGPLPGIAEQHAQVRDFITGQWNAHD